MHDSLAEFLNDTYFILLFRVTKVLHFIKLEKFADLYRFKSFKKVMIICSE